MRSLAEMQKLFEERGYHLLDKEYKNNMVVAE